MSEQTLESKLYATDDASVWAAEFVKLHGGDEGLMIGWFANAMETAKAIARHRSRDDCEDPWVCCIHEPPLDAASWTGGNG